MTPGDLSPEAWATLHALTSAPLAWLSPCELRGESGLEADVVEDALVELEIGGWIQPWETDDGLTVTLTAIAAEVLGLHLVEFGPEELPRWARDGTPDPKPPKAKGVFTRYSALSLVCDPALRPDLEAEYRELLAPYLIDLDFSPAKIRPDSLERRRIRDAARRAQKGRERRQLKRSRALRKRRLA